MSDINYGVWSGEFKDTSGDGNGKILLYGVGDDGWLVVVLLVFFFDLRVLFLGNIVEVVMILPLLRQLLIYNDCGTIVCDNIDVFSAVGFSDDDNDDDDDCKEDEIAAGETGIPSWGLIEVLIRKGAGYCADTTSYDLSGDCNWYSMVSHTPLLFIILLYATFLFFQQEL